MERVGSEKSRAAPKEDRIGIRVSPSLPGGRHARHIRALLLRGALRLPCHHFV